MSESYDGINIFGCSAVSVTSQFGLNQNPTIFNVKVLLDSRNSQNFTLPRGSTRQLTNISIGSLSIRGLVQSVEEQQINIGGSGLFTIKVTDTRPVLEATQVFLNAASNAVNLGENIISITPEKNADFEEGLRFSYLKTNIHNKTVKYGDNIFTIDLSSIILPSRGVNIEYRIKGTSMTLLELIQQVMTDHSLDWYVETSDTNVITVIPVDRSIRGINLDVLKVDSNVIRQTSGFENRDDINRSVLLGSQRQVLAFVDGPRFQQFWGFDSNGVPFTRPTFNIVYQNGQAITKITTEDEIRDVLNNIRTANDLGNDYFTAINQYGNDHWGRKFWFRITSSQIDSDNDPWVDVIGAGFWEGENPQDFLPSTTTRRPDDMPYEGSLKFGTDDGRYSAFVKLPSPGKRLSDRLKIKWDDSVKLSESVLVTKGGQWYMRCNVERFGVYMVVTLATPLVTTQNDTSLTDDTDIVRDRRTELAKAWLPILDKRKHYGPWSFEPINKSGRTELVIDTSINPWNFGFRDISLAEAVDNQNKVAYARLRSISVVTNEIDTAELEVTGLPRANIGSILGNGTNITGINVNFGTNGVTTSYRANLFTGELARLNKIYQDIVDGLKRKIRPSYFGPTNYSAITKEVANIKPDNTNPLSQQDSFDNSVVCRVIGREVAQLPGTPQPFYKLQPVKEILVNNGIIYEPINITFLANVRNKSERDGQPGRVPPGVIVTAFLSRAGSSAYYFEYSAQPPTVSPGVVEARVGERLYRVSLTTSDERLTEAELFSLDSVNNIGEPVNSPGRLAPGSTVEVTWLPNEDGTVTPQLNASVNVFGTPGE